MDRHLSELELNEVLAGNTSPEIDVHLAQCAICRAERDEAGYLFLGLNKEASRLADRPESFWRAQRESIQKRVPSHHGFTGIRLALAAVAAVVMVGIALLLRPGTSIAPHPHQQAPKVATDQQLMLEVEQTLASNVSPAFEPTDALMGAMTQSSAKASQSSTKENSNEN